MSDNQNEASPFVVPKLCIKRVPGTRQRKLPEESAISASESSKAAEQSNAGGLKLVLRVPKDVEPSQSDSKEEIEEKTEDSQLSEKDSDLSKESQNGESDEVKLSSFVRGGDVGSSRTKRRGSLLGTAPISNKKVAVVDESSTSQKRPPRKRKRFRLSTPAQKTKRPLQNDSNEDPMADSSSPKPTKKQAVKGGSKKKEAIKKEEAVVEEKSPVSESIVSSVALETDQSSKFPSPSSEMLLGFSPLQLLLDHVLKGFIKKDPEYYFAFPVTEDIAPNYSTIVSKPMDFLTIRNKIDGNEYKNLREFKADIELISLNAMLYNQKNTIYYVAAKKLKDVAEYMFSKDYFQEKLNAARKLIPQLSKLTYEDMGFTSDEIEKKREARKIRLGHYACIVDDMCPEEIMEQTRSAAAAAKEKLGACRPKIEVLFADPQGNDVAVTTLNMLMPEHIKRTDDDSTPNKKAQPVILGDLISKLKEGNPGLWKPDQNKDLVVPVSYLDQGPFSSFVPFYDSTWATLNKEESDLLLGTFGGDEQCVRYIDSIRTFAQDTNDYVSGIVEGIISDIIEDISPSINELENVQTSALDTASLNYNTVVNKAGSTNVGIPKISYDQTEPHGLQKMLDTNATAIQELYTIQNQRLSTRPPFVLTHAPEPSESEIGAALTVVSNLQQLSAQVTPAQLVSVDTVREALQGQKTNQQTNPSDECDMDILREFFVVDDKD